MIQYVAIHRKTENAIIAEPLIVWLCFNQYDISHTHDELYDTHTTNLKFDVKRRALDDKGR